LLAVEFKGRYPATAAAPRPENAPTAALGTPEGTYSMGGDMKRREFLRSVGMAPVVAVGALAGVKAAAVYEELPMPKHYGMPKLADYDVHPVHAMGPSWERNWSQWAGPEVRGDCAAVARGKPIFRG
jgi:hypothetical protein